MACVTCACTPCNQTLFKQSGSKTEDSERVETVITPANTYPPEHRGSFINQCSSEYSGPRQTHRTATSCAAGSSGPEGDIRSTVAHFHSARGTFTAPCVFLRVNRPAFELVCLKFPTTVQHWAVTAGSQESPGLQQWLYCVQGPNTAQLESFSDSWMANRRGGVGGLIRPDAFYLRQASQLQQKKKGAQFPPQHTLIPGCGTLCMNHFLSSHRVIGTVTCCLLSEEEWQPTGYMRVETRAWVPFNASVRAKK